MLVFMICDLQAATIKMRDVIGCLKKPEFSDFVLFLQLAEVYGSGYQDDVDYAKFSLRSTETHSDQMVFQLERILEAYSITLTSLEIQRKESLIGKLVTHHEEFTRMIQF